MGFWKWLTLAEEPDLETRHTDTDPSAYPLEWQLDAVVWHQINGLINPEALPAIYAAVDLIAASVAQLATDPETPLTRLPDVFDTRYNFFFETTWSLAMGGDAFWLLTPMERGIETMQTLAPTEVQVAWDQTMPRLRREYQWQGNVVDRSRIRHLRFHPRPGELLGMSPVDAAQQTWAGAVRGEEWASGLFANSGVPSGVIEVPTMLSKPEADSLKAQWDESRKGKKDTGILSGGAVYKPVSLSPSDMEFLASRASVAQEVARIFHIPEDLLAVAIQGGSSSITYKNLAEVGADFVQYALSPFLTIIEQAWVSLPGQPAINFDTTPLYKESLETRARTLQMLIAAGVDPDQAARECGFDLEIDTPEPATQEAPV